MEEIKKSTRICFSIEAIRLIALTLNVVLLKLNLYALPIGGLGVAISFIASAVMCNIISSRAMRKNLKAVAPDIYGEVYKNWPLQMGFDALSFAFTSNHNDTTEIKSIKRHFKYSFLLVCIQFISSGILMVICGMLVDAPKQN